MCFDYFTSSIHHKINLKSRRYLKYSPSTLSLSPRLERTYHGRNKGNTCDRVRDFSALIQHHNHFMLPNTYAISSQCKKSQRLYNWVSPIYSSIIAKNWTLVSIWVLHYIHVSYVFPYYYFQTMILQHEYVGRFGHSRIRETKGFY